MAHIKDCLIVAAGKGTRIKGLGDLKPMINLGGKPLIEHAMLAAAKNGVEHFVVVTGYKAELLQTFLDEIGKKNQWKITTVFNPDFELENGISVLAGAPYLKNEFFLAMCDHIVDPAIYSALLANDLPAGSVGLGIDTNMDNPNVDLEDVTKVFMNGRSIQMVDKQLSTYNAFDTGIFRANPRLFSAIKLSWKKSGDCSISGGMRVLAMSGLARGIDIGDAPWFDVDSQDMHEKALSWLQSEKAKRQGNTTNLGKRKIVAVGHRGSIKYAPENTLVAHEAAFAMGARGIEFDVRCTKDGHFVLMHDAKIDRTTNGRGLVKNMTLEDIKQLDAGIHKGPQFKGEKVPSLREALRNVRGRFVVDIDFKGGPKNSAEILARVLEEEGFDKGQLVTIFARWQHYKLLLGLNPKYAIRPHYITAGRTRKISAPHQLGVMGLRRIAFSFRAAQAIRNNNLHLFCNVMGRHDNDRGFEDCIKAGALFIQSDHIDKLVHFLEQRDLLETRVLARDYLPIRDEAELVKPEPVPENLGRFTYKSV